MQKIFPVLFIFFLNNRVSSAGGSGGGGYGPIASFNYTISPGEIRNSIIETTDCTFSLAESSDQMVKFPSDSLSELVFIPYTGIYTLYWYLYPILVFILFLFKTSLAPHRHDHDRRIAPQVANTTLPANYKHIKLKLFMS